MNENDVVKATCKYLKDQGYTILTTCTTNQRGIDITAKNPTTGIEVFVEAKGNTSSKEGSARYGKPYTNSQVFSHTSKGVFACLRLRVQYFDREKQRVILAVPDSQLYRKYLEPVILDNLKTAGVEVLFFK